MFKEGQIIRQTEKIELYLNSDADKEYDKGTLWRVITDENEHGYFNVQNLLDNKIAEGCDNYFFEAL